VRWLSRPARVVDIGAHQGGFLKQLEDAASALPNSSGSRKLGHLREAEITALAFKPNLTNIDALNFNFPGAKIERAAVSDVTNADRTLFVPKMEYASELASLSSTVVGRDDTAEVSTPVWALDDYLATQRSSGSAADGSSAADGGSAADPGFAGFGTAIDILKVGPPSSLRHPPQRARCGRFETNREGRWGVGCSPCAVLSTWSSLVCGDLLCSASPVFCHRGITVNVPGATPNQTRVLF
jgi:hypothetical protein